MQFLISSQKTNQSDRDIVHTNDLEPNVLDIRLSQNSIVTSEVGTILKDGKTNDIHH